MIKQTIISVHKNVFACTFKNHKNFYDDVFALHEVKTIN